MIKIFEKPEYMTVEEIEEKFYPVSVVIANCMVECHAPQAGYVMAAETIPVDDYEELFDYQIELTRGKRHGEVYMITTKLPFEGENIFVEFAEQNTAKASNAEALDAYLSMWAKTEHTD